MWTNNTRNAKVKGESNRNVVMKILILIFFFFKIKELKITRGHHFTLVKKQSGLGVRTYSFSQRTINVWNELSTDCVHVSSVNVFKNRLDKYLVKACYT